MVALKVKRINTTLLKKKLWLKTKILNISQKMCHFMKCKKKSLNITIQLQLFCFLKVFCSLWGQFFFNKIFFNFFECSSWFKTFLYDYSFYFMSLHYFIIRKNGIFFLHILFYMKYFYFFCISWYFVCFLFFFYKIFFYFFSNAFCNSMHFFYNYSFYFIFH